MIRGGRRHRLPPPTRQRRNDRLTAAGCAVLWIAPPTYSLPMDGAHLTILPDPADVADTIGAAATHTLRNA